MPERHYARAVARTLFGLVFIAVLAVGVGLAAHWPHRTPPTPIATVATPAPTGGAARIEWLTQLQLATLEEGLAQDLSVAQQAPGHHLIDLRTAAIGFSMWGPLADLSQASLSALGEHAWLRQGLIFALPMVRWMSAPFLFPVDPSPQDGRPAAAFEPVLKLIAAKAAVGRGVSLDNVGDASASPAQSAAYRDYYANLFRAYGASGATLPLHVSLKLSALVHDLPAALQGPENPKRAEILAALRYLLAVAHDTCPAGFFMRIDMEEYAYKDLTLGLFLELVTDTPELTRDGRGGLHLGIVTQAYLRDSAHDLAALADWGRAQGVRVPVRLVKGAYEVYEKDLAAATGRKSPVWDYKASTDANYEALGEFLLRHPDAFDPAFATHNLRTQARVMAVADALGRPATEVEFQMLYGMGDPIKGVLIKLGYRLREYVPAGPLYRGLTYAGRRFHELANPDNALARSLQGDFSVLSEQPHFEGATDSADGAFTRVLLGPDDKSGPGGAGTQ